MMKTEGFEDLPNDFSPAGFMYLNPEVHCPSAEFAQKYYITCSNDLGRVCHYKTEGIIPQEFNAASFLRFNASNASLIQVNRNVLEAMTSEGNFTKDEIRAAASVMPSIGQAAHVVEVDDCGWQTIVFKFNDPYYMCPVDLLKHGDFINIGLANSTNNNAMYPPRHIDVCVTAVDTSNQTFSVSNVAPSWNFEIGRSYRVVGHHVYDIDRVASIFWLMRNIGGKEDGGPIDGLLWSSNAAYEALRLCTWCSNAVTSMCTPLETSFRIEAELSNLAANTLKLSPNGVVEKVVEFEAKTIVCSNVMARSTVTVGTPFGDRPAVALEVHGPLRAEDYIVSSDERIKQDVMPLDSVACFKAVSAMEPISYSKKGFESSNDARRRYGFVAQSLADIDSAFVRKINGFVPTLSRTAEVDAHGFVNFGRNHGLCVGDRLLAYGSKSNHSEEVVVMIRRIINDEMVAIEGQSTIYNTTPFFVGKEVNDFHVIDQTHVITVLAGALKEAIARIEKLEVTSKRCSGSFC